MTKRLSSSTNIGLYDSGLKGFRYSDELTKNPSLWSENLNHLAANVSSSNAAKIIEKVPAQDIYRAIKNIGLEEAYTLLPLLSREQWQKIADYDFWSKDYLAPKKLFKWLQAFARTDQKFIYQRFKELDEEYQIAVLQPYINMFDKEQFDKMLPEQQDCLIPLPGEQVFYTILTDDKELHASIKALLDSTSAENMNYCLSLLSHANYMPPNECEDKVNQFRKARMEEDGFVSFEESLRCFTPADIAKLKKIRQKKKTTLATHFKYKRKVFLLTKSLRSLNHKKNLILKNNFTRSMSYLANCLCQASSVEADDIQTLKLLLIHCKGIINLALEYLSSMDLERALIILQTQHPKHLFSVGLGLVHECRSSFLEQISKKLGTQSKIKKYYQRAQFGLLLDQLDKEILPSLGLERTETIKAFFNRLPLVPKQKSENKYFLTLSIALKNYKMSY